MGSGSTGKAVAYENKERNAKYNFIGVIVGGVLHAYFDAFGAFVQTTIFTTLTLLLISSEIPAPVNVDLNKKEKKQRKAKKALEK